MASTRKARIVNKRFSKLTEESPDKDASNPNKTRPKKRKLSDMLGCEWSKDELERFYVSYRKYGKDWKKVAGTIRNRTTEMVEALYTMNRAYLSLPEGTATVAGLIAMMTDHYNILGESDSADADSNDGLQTSRMPPKKIRGKLRPSGSKGSESSYPDLLQYPSATASYGCLSLLKKKRSGGSRPRAVGKRTPRFPVSYTYAREDKNKFVSPYKHVKSEGDADDDEGLHVAALALTEASQRGGSPQVSRTPGRIGRGKSSPVQSSERKHTESELASAKFIAGRKDDDDPEGSLGSIEAETGDFVLDNGFPQDSDNANIVETQQKVRKSKGKKPRTMGLENSLLDDDVKEACSGTEEGLSVRGAKAEVDSEVSDRKATRPSQGPRKRVRQLFSGDETTALDALQTLADLSFNILLPGSTIESESSVQAKEDKKSSDAVEKPTVPEKVTVKGKKEKSTVTQKKYGGQVGARKVSKQTKPVSPSLGANIPQGTEHENEPKNNIRKKKKKPATYKVKDEVLKSTCSVESPKKETIIDESKKCTSKTKSANQVPSQKQTKFIKALEQASSGPAILMTETNEPEPTSQTSTEKHTTLQSKPQNRRKAGLQKVLASRDVKPSSVGGEEHFEKHTTNGRVSDLKEKISHCLSSPLLRRWCIFEWFYSAIDYPWFAKSEFVEYLNHVGLGHVPRLTRVEWGVIRSSLGKPRRLSKQFLQEEREKLELYRESVRTHYTELRSGISEGLPADLARPLSVGQRVIACHPKMREIHDGSILTVDRNRCRVQFERPELGVEFVMDIDCMPLSPSENMPDALRRKNLLVDKISETFYETKSYSQSQDWRFPDSLKFSSNESVENAEGSCNVVSSSFPMNTLMKQAKGDTIDAIVEARAAASEVAAAAQQAMLTQPYTLAQVQAREADIRALAELTRALDKKEALLIELRNMNEEVSTKQKEGDSIKEFEHFRKQYAMVLLQLRDANNQVASALLYLRQRNTYHGNSTPPWLKPMDCQGSLSGAQGSIVQCGFPNPETGTHVLQIVEGSRRKARAMVDVAVKALSSLKEGENAFARVGEALDNMKAWQSATESTISSVKPVLASEAGQSTPFQDQAGLSKSEGTTNQTCTLKTNTSNGIEGLLPSELISSCVATLLMIQTCTERHDPPAEVTQILDSAVSSMQPCCPQNLPLYREIETCMGIIKNQMLAKIPTPSTSDVTVM